MARTSVTVQTTPRFGASLDDVTFTAGDAANDHEFVNDGNTLLLMKNTDASGKTATIPIVQNSRSLNKSGLTQTLTASGGGSEICIAGPFDPDIFNQTGGVVHVDLTDDTGVSFAAVKLQRSPRT